MSSSEIPDIVHQQRAFAIIAADNFDMNIGTLRGENSIHILNRIIIQAPENDKLKSDVNECLNDLCESVVSVIDENFGLPSKLTGKISNISNTLITTNRNEPNVSNKDESYRDASIAYGLMKYYFDKDSNIRETDDKTREIKLPLLSGFFATYLPNAQRHLSKITFLPPIKQDTSSLTTSQLCLKSAKMSLIDSHFQKEMVIVVDENIYRNCAKVSSLIGLMTLQIYY